MFTMNFSLKMLVLSLGYIYLFLGGVNAAKILLVPWTQKSHVKFFAIAARALQEDGHQVTLLATDIYAKNHNVPTVEYSFPTGGNFHDAFNTNEGLSGFWDYYTLVQRVTEAVNKTCHHVLGDESLKLQLERANFDIVVSDSFPPIACFMAIPHRLGIPHIFLGPWIDAWSGGLPVLPSHETHPLPSYHGKMDFKMRIINTVAQILTDHLLLTYIVGDDFLEKYSPDRPIKTVKQLAQEASMWLITTEIIAFDFPRISSPNYRFIGSLGARQEIKPLPKNLKDFMKNSEDGVIIVSFGTIEKFQDVAKPNVGKLISALNRLGQKFIIQNDGSFFEQQTIPPNILVLKWLPQNDLLGHNKTKLFIGHGGLNGLLEATYNGVPSLTIPFQSEQSGNGHRAKSLGHGDVLYWDEATEDDYHKTIKELISNPVYKTNVQKCAEIMRSMPDSKKELVFWINHVLRFGHQHLRLLAADMPWWQFWMIDVMIFFLGISFIFTISFYFICRFFCCRSSKKKKVPTATLR